MFAPSTRPTGPTGSPHLPLLRLLGTIFASPVKAELIPANPAHGTDQPALSDKPVEVWEPDQVRVFLGRGAQLRPGALFEVAHTDLPTPR